MPATARASGVDRLSAADSVHRGDAYRLQGNYERAVADYSEALRLNPHFPLALVLFGCEDGKPRQSPARLAGPTVGAASRAARQSPARPAGGPRRRGRRE